MRAGDVIEQRVRISTTAEGATRSALAPTSGTGTVAVRIDFDAEAKPLPSIGVLSDIDSAAIRAASALGVSHLRISLDTRSENAADDLAAAHQVLVGSDIGIELELVADDPTGVSGLRTAIAELRDRLRWVFVFDRKTQITSGEYGPELEDLRTIIGPHVGGGSGSNFAAINFNIDEIALSSLDALTFPMSPQVHYTDHFSFLTNLDAQRAIVASGRRIAGDRPISVGPITLLPRRAGEPLMPDPRSNSLLAAAWTVASLSELITSGADALTYHQMGGPGGITAHDGGLTPTYHLLAELGEYGSARYVPGHIDSPGARVAMIVWRRQSDALIVVANLEPESVDIELPLPSDNVTKRTLDETTYDLARRERAVFTNSTIPWDGGGLRLLPFAVSMLKVGVLTTGRPVSQSLR